MNALKPRRLLILGGTSGIGEALIRSLVATHPVKLGVHYHSNEKCKEQLEISIANSNSEAFFLRTELFFQEECHRLIDSYVEWADGIDAMIQLTGGVAAVRSWRDVIEKEWVQDLALNLNAPYFLAQRAMEHMSKAKGGKIILTSTASAQHGGGADTIAYGVAKAGIEFLTKSLARIGAPHSILVNAVAPGFIETKFHTETLDRGHKQIKERIEKIPLKRSGSANEVAAVIKFLLSGECSFITGEVISVSGGDWL